MAKRILFVCLGNICRSPAAEGIFLHLIEEAGLQSSFVVDSAGTGAWHVGKKADSRMLQAAKARGVSLPSIARQITVQDFNEFELILTMDSDNLDTVKSLKLECATHSKAAIKPILSFARNTSLTEVPDPYYGGKSGFEDVLDLLEDACAGLLNQLTSKG